MLVSVKPVVDFLEALSVRVGPLVPQNAEKSHLRQAVQPAERDVALRLP